MSAGSGYNDWESDLSSIIEKTNQNLKLLRRIGEKRSDLSGSQAYDVSTTASVRPTSAAQIASEMRSFATSISSRYAAEDAATTARARSSTGIPRATATATAAAASSRKLNRSSSVGIDARARARESLIIRPPAPTQAFAASSDGEPEGDERLGSPRSRHGVGSRSSSIKRASSVTGRAKSSGSSRATMNTSNDVRFSSSDQTAAAVEELRKSLEVHIASRSSTFEKALSDLRVDMSGVTNEANALAMRMNELRDSVVTKMSSLSSLTQASSEHGESIGRLEKHSAVLLGWKVGVDQDLFEIANKMKSFASIQDKMTSLEGHLEALGTTIKTTHRAGRYDEKIDEVKDRVAMLERLTAQQLDTKAVEHTVQMRVTREINELEGRINQSLAFLAQKLETKLQTLEKAVASDRIDALAALKNDLVEDIDKVESKAVKKQELAALQNAHSQMKEDIAHFQLFFERQDKRFQELKQNATQIRDELVETRQELTKALHSQQHRVSTTLEEKVAQLTVVSKDKNAKVEQKVGQLEKRQKKLEDQCTALQEGLNKVKQNAISQRAADSVSQQRENEKLRQRLVRSLAELEQIHSTRLEVERTYESKEKVLQTKLKELKTQVDDQERARESQRAELTQAIQNESKQLGIVQGKNALLEKLLEKEKADREKKTEQLHKSRLEMTQIRQKMRALENEVDKKMQKLSSELHAKQLQVDTLLKRLKRSEDEIAKLDDSAKREKRQLSRTKELKQQELHLAYLKLKEFEKMAVNAAAKDAALASERGAVSMAQMSELDVKCRELELALGEREADLKDLKTDIEKLTAERDTVVKRQKETMDTTLKDISEEFEAKIHELELCARKKDDDIRRLQENLVERSELLALEGMLSSLQNEKESLVEELRSEQRKLDESESLLRSNYKVEITQLTEQLEERVREIQEAHCALQECRNRIGSLEEEIGSKELAYKDEIAHLSNELRASKSEAEQLIQQSSELEDEKRLVDRKIEEVELQLQVASRRDEQRQQEIDDLRQDVETLTSERQTLIQSLDIKSKQLDELVHSEELCRARLADVVRDQEEMRVRLEGELEELRTTLSVQSESSVTERRSLESTVDTLRKQFEMAKRESEEGASSCDDLQSEIQRLIDQLSQAHDRELHLDSILSAIIEEVTALSVVSAAECQTDPVLAIRRHAEAAAMNVNKLDSLVEEHQAVMADAASQRARAHQLKLEVDELSSQMEQVQASNCQLRAELEAVYAESARLSDQSGRLNDDILKLREEKCSLLEQVEKLTTECENVDATAQIERNEKDSELAKLRDANAKLENTIQTIRDTMERIEANKALELDTLTAQLQELEVQLLTATNDLSSEVPTADKDFFSNQQIIASHGQAIRVMYSKLLSGCSVVDIHELKAAITGTESKLQQLRDEYTGERQQCSDEEDELLFSLDFMESLLSESNESTWSGLATKYVRVVPSLVSRLQRVQQLYIEVLQQSTVYDSDSQCRPDENANPDTQDGLIGRTDNRTDESGPDEIFDEDYGSMDEDEQCPAEESTSQSMVDTFQADPHSQDISTSDTDDSGYSPGYADNGSRAEREMSASGNAQDSGSTDVLNMTTSVLTVDLQSRTSDGTAQLAEHDELSVPPQCIVPCTALLHSPTYCLRESTFTPLPSSTMTAYTGKNDSMHMATKSENTGDNLRDTDGSLREGDDETDDANEMPESCDIDGEEEDAESLSQSLESMIRLVGGENDQDAGSDCGVTSPKYGANSDHSTKSEHHASLRQMAEITDEGIADEGSEVDEDSFDGSLNVSSDETHFVTGSASPLQSEMGKDGSSELDADQINRDIPAGDSMTASTDVCTENNRPQPTTLHSAVRVDMGDDRSDNEDDMEGSEGTDNEPDNKSVSSHGDDDVLSSQSCDDSTSDDQCITSGDQFIQGNHTASLQSRRHDTSVASMIDALTPTLNLTQITSSSQFKGDGDDYRHVELAMGISQRAISGESSNTDMGGAGSDLNEQSSDTENHRGCSEETLNSCEDSPERLLCHESMIPSDIRSVNAEAGPDQLAAIQCSSHVALLSNRRYGEDNEEEAIYHDNEEGREESNAYEGLIHDRIDYDHSGTDYADVNDEVESSRMEVNDGTTDGNSPDALSSALSTDTSARSQPMFGTSLRMEDDEDESDDLIDSSESEDDAQISHEDDEAEFVVSPTQQHVHDIQPRIGEAGEPSTDDVMNDKLDARSSHMDEERLDSVSQEDSACDEFDDECSIDSFGSGDGERETTSGISTRPNDSSSCGVQDHAYGGTSSSLMKALHATRSLGGRALDEIDDDMDEVERLMASQTLQFKSQALSEGSLKRDAYDDGGDLGEDQNSEDDGSTLHQTSKEKNDGDGNAANDGGITYEDKADDQLDGETFVLRDELNSEEFHVNSDHKINFESDRQHDDYDETNAQSTRSSGPDTSGTVDTDSNLTHQQPSPTEGIEDGDKVEEESDSDGEGDENNGDISIQTKANYVGARLDSISLSGHKVGLEDASEGHISEADDLQREYEDGGDIDEISDAVDSSFGEGDLEQLLESHRNEHSDDAFGNKRHQVQTSIELRNGTTHKHGPGGESTDHEGNESAMQGHQRSLESLSHDVPREGSSSAICEKLRDDEADLEQDRGVGASSFDDDELEVAMLTGINSGITFREMESHTDIGASSLSITRQYRADDPDHRIEETKETMIQRTQHEESSGDNEDADSIDETSEAFGSSFADDDLERALQGRSDSNRDFSDSAQDTSGIPVSNRKDIQVKNSGGSNSSDVLGVAHRSRARDDEDSDEDEEPLQPSFSPTATPAPSSFLMGRGILQPLPSLTGLKKPTLNLGRTHIDYDEDDEDDMDEVERLLLEQTSMKTVLQTGVKTSNIGTRRFEVDEDDDFDAPYTGAPETPLRRADLPIAHDDDDEFAHFDRDEDGDDDDHKTNRSDLIDQDGSLSDAASSAPSSPSRIPIMPGSSLLKKDAMSTVTRQQSPVQRQRMASENSEDDGADAYLEESFDLEESIQEDDEDA